MTKKCPTCGCSKQTGKRQKFVGFFVSDEELVTIDTEKAKLGMTRADYMRAAVLAEIWRAK